MQQACKLAYQFDPAVAIADAKSATFKTAAEDWLREHVVEASGLRSAEELERPTVSGPYGALLKLRSMTGIRL